MKIARLSTLLGISLLTLAALIVPAQKAHADDTVCSNNPNGVNVCCTWQGPRLVGCIQF